MGLGSPFKCENCGTVLIIELNRRISLLAAFGILSADAMITNRLIFYTLLLVIIIWLSFLYVKSNVPYELREYVRKYPNSKIAKQQSNKLGD